MSVEIYVLIFRILESMQACRVGNICILKFNTHHNFFIYFQVFLWDIQLMLREFDCCFFSINSERIDFLSMKIKKDILGLQGACVQKHFDFNITFVSCFLVKIQTEFIKNNLFDGAVTFFSFLMRQVVSVLICEISIKYCFGCFFHNIF